MADTPLIVRRDKGYNKLMNKGIMGVNGELCLMAGHGGIDEG